MSLLQYVLSLADTALIAGHRNSEWTGHGPILEQDIALSNIALDQVGQARMLYQYAALLSGDGATEDTLAYLRDAREYKNCLLVELPNGHWGNTILKQFFLSAYQFPLYDQLRKSENVQLAAIAEKSIREVTYHLRWSSEWVIRLGDGTTESKTKMQQALDELWRYTGELYTPAPYEETLVASNTAADLSQLKTAFTQRVEQVISEATLTIPPNQPWQTGGKTGMHTEHLGFLLAEMQFLQRAYPGNEW